MNKKQIQIALNEIESLWCETFGISDLNKDFIPHLKKEVKEYIKDDIHLKLGSLLKLIQKDRIDFIDKIRPTLEEPNIVLDDNQGILFIKEFVDIDKNRYFMSVAKNYDGEWICTSHTRREFNNIQNKIANSKIIYNQGFQRDEVAGASDILESGGEVSKPSDLQIKYTANQDFGKNPNNIIPHSQESFSNLSPTEKLTQLQRNQESISQMPKVSEALNKDSNSLQNSKEQKEPKDFLKPNNQEKQEQKSQIRRHK